MSPTLGDLEAYRLFTLKYERLVEMDHRARQTRYISPFAVESWREHSSRRSNWDTSIVDVMRLMRMQYPCEQTPALDHAFRTKGIEATEKDLADLWRLEREKPTAAEDDKARVLEGLCKTEAGL